MIVCSGSRPSSSPRRNSIPNSPAPCAVWFVWPVVSGTRHPLSRTGRNKPEPIEAHTLYHYVNDFAMARKQHNFDFWTTTNTGKGKHGNTRALSFLSSQKKTDGRIINRNFIIRARGACTAARIRSERPGDAPFFEGSVQFTASTPREELSTALAASVVAKASALLAYQNGHKPRPVTNINYHY